MSYDAALAEAKAKNRLVLIDFTGVFCPNCRTVEQSVMPRPDTVEELKKFVTVSLFTDHLDINSLSVSDREDGGAANLAFEDELTGQTTSPLYTVVTPDGKLLGYKGVRERPEFPPRLPPIDPGEARPGRKSGGGRRDVIPNRDQEIVTPFSPDVTSPMTQAGTFASSRRVRAIELA